MKARIYADHGRVILEHDGDPDYGEPPRVTHTYIGKPDRYVYELRPDGSTTQPCDGLSGSGNTLYCGPSLLETIRREWRKGRRA